MGKNSDEHDIREEMARLMRKLRQVEKAITDNSVAHYRDCAQLSRRIRDLEAGRSLGYVDGAPVDKPTAFGELAIEELSVDAIETKRGSVVLCIDGFADGNWRWLKLSDENVIAIAALATPKSET